MSDRIEPSRWVRPAQLRAARAYLGLSCKDFCRMTGIGTATLNRYESADGEQPTGSHAVAVTIANTLTSLGVRCIEVPAAENTKNGDGEDAAACAAGGIIVDQAAFDRTGKGDKIMKTFIAAMAGSVLGAAALLAGAHIGGVYAFGVETASSGVRAAGNVIQTSADTVVSAGGGAIFMQERKVEKPSDPGTCTAITERVVEVSKRLYTEGSVIPPVPLSGTWSGSGPVVRSVNSLQEMYRDLLDSAEKLGCGFANTRAAGLLSVDLKKIGQPTEVSATSEAECAAITAKAGEVLREQVKHNPASKQAEQLAILYKEIVGKARWCNIDRIIVEASMSVDPSTVWGVKGEADPSPSAAKPD